ncbi:hypothetical protein J7E50_25595 [Pedobacter sp. ISL-68]|uniref:hypothetical protein n=1 Tax=unclassified Pedobacter TaxID=2628915 RepID=UPI001BE53DFE|nr:MULTISPECIES: hypothetical protein [unclassified Pedobacter]MBT2560478.1 hypothetical protein [Pedobacter sp. ISL-64]MBT2593615.1 hypothetical protein [Pedobacter sp. ISL-68]
MNCGNLKETSISLKAKVFDLLVIITFVAMGGRVLKEYEFKFIEPDGCLKRNAEMK